MDPVNIDKKTERSINTRVEHFLQLGYFCSQASFAILQEQLEGSENRVTIARQRYNEAVRRYNTKTITFPGNLIAAIFGFERNDGYFEATEKAGESLQIQI